MRWYLKDRSTHPQRPISLLNLRARQPPLNFMRQLIQKTVSPKGSKFPINISASRLMDGRPSAESNAHFPQRFQKPKVIGRSQPMRKSSKSKRQREAAEKAIVYIPRHPSYHQS